MGVVILSGTQINSLLRVGETLAVVEQLGVLVHAAEPWSAHSVFPFEMRFLETVRVDIPSTVEISSGLIKGSKGI